MLYRNETPEARLMHIRGWIATEIRKEEFLMLYDLNWTPPAEAKVKSKRKTWRSLMLKAAEILKSDGWIQGKYHSSEGSCTLGALRKADNKGKTTEIEYSASYYLAEKILEAHVLRHSSFDCIANWNDHDGNNMDQVIETLKKVANE